MPKKYRGISEITYVHRTNNIYGFITRNQLIPVVAFLYISRTYYELHTKDVGNRRIADEGMGRK